MTSRYQSQINRLEQATAKLDQDDAAEARKESELIAKINRADDAARRATSNSQKQSRAREHEQASKNLVAVKKKRADISKRKAETSHRLRDYRTRQIQDEERGHRKIADEQRRLMREREAHERRISSELRSRHKVMSDLDDYSIGKVYDFFISHASEDKDAFVRELSELLREKGAEVWYDEFTLTVGDSLRKEIDRGLANSRFGVVVLSEHFFKKEWPDRELNGLFALEHGDQKRILPIWHKVSKDEVAQYSPMLADKLALNTSVSTVDEIANELMHLIQDERAD